LFDPNTPNVQCADFSFAFSSSSVDKDNTKSLVLRSLLRDCF